VIIVGKGQNVTEKKVERAYQKVSSEGKEYKNGKREINDQKRGLGKRGVLKDHTARRKGWNKQVLLWGCTSGAGRGGLQGAWIRFYGRTRGTRRRWKNAVLNRLWWEKRPSRGKLPVDGGRKATLDQVYGRETCPEPGI